MEKSQGDRSLGSFKNQGDRNCGIKTTVPVPGFFYYYPLIPALEPNRMTLPIMVEYFVKVLMILIV
jgi:hypothetical protein